MRARDRKDGKDARAADFLRKARDLNLDQLIKAKRSKESAVKAWRRRDAVKKQIEADAKAKAKEKQSRSKRRRRAGIR